MAALVTLFPELSLDESKFSTLRSIHFIPSSRSSSRFLLFLILMVEKFWHDNKNRRRVFEEVADELGFDPLLPESWYSTSSDVIKSNLVFLSPILPVPQIN